jgi:hypothetical protein
MIPSYEEYRSGHTTWKGEHRGISYSLAHWGISSYQRYGIWNYYIHLLEEQFVNPDDFAKFNLEQEIYEFAGSKRAHYPYDNLPDVELYGGITFYSKDTYINREGKTKTAVKFGCDYNHGWDREQGYPQDKAWVERDAKHSIDVLLDGYNFIWKERCAWSGKWDISENFYTAKNGSRVHKSKAAEHANNAYWSPVEKAAL